MVGRYCSWPGRNYLRCLAFALCPSTDHTILERIPNDRIGIRGIECLNNCGVCGSPWGPIVTYTLAENNRRRERGEFDLQYELDNQGSMNMPDFLHTTRARIRTVRP